jgi:dolichol-phosphate mannosyltransferase
LLAAVVIPTYNEKENISKLIPKILSLKVAGTKFKIIVVDDNSPDGTAKAVKKFSNVILISRPFKLGLGSAYVAGFKKAISLNADVVFSMDADHSHDFYCAKDFIKAIREGADVAIGSRYIPGGGTNWEISRKIISGGANFLARSILGVPATDLTSGYRCYRIPLLKKVINKEFKSTSYSFLEELIYYCHKSGAKIAEVPIFFADRVSGKSKLRKMEILKFPFTLLRLRFFS